MSAAAAGLIAVLMFILGLGLGLHMKAKQEIRSLFAEAGLTIDTARRYRTAAKILHDLVYINDLDGPVPVLPPEMQTRVEDWLREHNDAIHKGSPS